MQQQVLVKKQKPKKKPKKKEEFYIYLLKKALNFKVGRDILISQINKRLYTTLVNDKKYPKKVQVKKYEYLMAMLECAKRNIDKGFISTDVVNRGIDTLVKLNMLDSDEKAKNREKFVKQYGMNPTSFLVFSPTQRCNLKCVGCYASSTKECPQLPFETVDKILDEVYNEWGNRFMAISGGEPFMYNDKGKTLFDIWEKYKQMYFLVYTNGTLITKEVAERLAKLGNVTPAISVEGWELETDDRRGKGIFKKIVEAANNLKAAGVPFGVSVTTTSKNYKVLMDEKFYDFIFQELGATYMWMFQIMPIGQAKDIKEYLNTPEQRVNMYRMWEKMLHEKKYCIADFWNSGVLSNGCVAYGREGGYMYLDWNGNIMPCVFVPFYEDNVIDLYKKGKKLADALNSPLFVNGRKWQEKYGLKHTENPDNWLMPCSIRDHWKEFKKEILSPTAKPEDLHAEQLIKSAEHAKIFEKFDEDLEKLTVPIWKKEYMESEDELSKE